MKLGRGDARHPFDGDLLESVSWSLGHYSALQSINSEDAITWSFFGPLMLAEEASRVAFLNWLMGVLGLPWTDNKRCTFDLWRRIPHPRKPEAPGPELDVVIDGDQVVAFVEAKWRSVEGRGQGPDGSATQMQLRAEFFERWGQALYGDRGQAVLGLTDGLAIGEQGDRDVAIHSLTWNELADYGDHPNGSEFADYLAWKRRLSK